MPNPPILAVARPDLSHAAALLPVGERPRLRMEPALTRTGVVDGAWWPRTGSLRAELPGLVTTLAALLGPIVAVGVDADAWTDVPARLVVDGRVVRVTTYAASDGTMTVVRGPMDHFLLLVLPPPTSPASAGSTMALAARTAGTTPIPALQATARHLTPEDYAATAWEEEGGSLPLS